MIIFQIYLLIAVLVLAVCFIGAQDYRLSLIDYYYMASASLMWPLTLGLLFLCWIGIIDDSIL